jgi:hypothetical protein
MSYLHDLLSVASGGLVSFALSIGGGGWILAAPLLIHVVGVASPYVAMARVRLRSPADATFDLIGHARANDRMASCHGIRCLSGITGATVRLELGKMIDGRKLLLFGGLGLVIPLITRRATPVDIVGPPSEVHWASTCAGVPPNATAAPVFIAHRSWGSASTQSRRHWRLGADAANAAIVPANGVRDDGIHPLSLGHADCRPDGGREFAVIPARASGEST